MKIGIFDSGIGGLSILSKALTSIPDARFLYYADSKNVPYGEKSPEDILRFSSDAVSFLVDHGAQAVVIACNTATSVAVSHLRSIYESEPENIPIIGMEPAVKRAIDLGSGGRIIMAATPVTVTGKKLELLLERYDKDSLTDSLPLPSLVRFAENEDFDSREVTDYLLKKLSAFELERYSALVLGCTHFNYFKDSLRRILPDSVALIDGIEGTVRRLCSRLGISPRDCATRGDASSLNASELAERVSFFISGTEVKSENDLCRFKRLLSRLAEMDAIM